MKLEYHVNAKGTCSPECPNKEDSTMVGSLACQGCEHNSGVLKAAFVESCTDEVDCTFGESKCDEVCEWHFEVCFKSACGYYSTDDMRDMNYCPKCGKPLMEEQTQ